MRSSEGETELVRQTREVLLTDSERNRERERVRVRETGR